MTRKRRRSYRPVLLVALLVGVGSRAWLNRLVRPGQATGAVRSGARAVLHAMT